MKRVLVHGCIFALLTVLTQLGGIAWLIALLFRRRALVFALAYLALWGAAIGLAPLGNRVPLHCWNQGGLQMKAWVFCAANRNYMAPELLDALKTASGRFEAEFPGSNIQVLDANFPFLDGFPLLPHLSHDDGGKVDIALFYKDGNGNRRETSKSPIGYFAFEDGPTHCPKAWPSLRWDLHWLQPLWPDWPLDDARTKRVVEILVADPRVKKLFIEPHLASRLDLTNSKIRFQGCRAARHDDHIHLQI